MTELSLYEQVADLSTIKKQWFFDLFQGDALDTDRWDSTTNVTGTGSVTMLDAINGGVEFKDTAGSSGVHFGQKRQFNEDGCVGIWYAKVLNNVSEHEFGFGSSGVYTDSQNYALTGIEGASGVDWFHLDTQTGATNTVTDSTVAVDTDYHTFKITCRPTDVDLDIGGIQVATTTSNVPLDKMEPAIFFRSRSSTTAQVTTRYVECYNT